MFSRRVATFLLGVWIGCCLLVDMFALQGRTVVDRILASSAAEARDLIAKGGPSNVTPLLQHVGNEQIRALIYNWEPAQLVLGFGIVVLLVFTDQRKLIALSLTGVMAILTLIQHVFITPEWIDVGRQADLLPEAASFSLRAHHWTLTETYGVLEIVKLLIGGALASYFFVMESVKRTRRKEQRRDEDLAAAR